MGGVTSKQKRAMPARSVRASVTFPAELYYSLEDIARQKKVSLAWVVREAAEQYIGNMWPLFKRPKGE